MFVREGRDGANVLERMGTRSAVEISRKSGDETVFQVHRYGSSMLGQKLLLLQFCSIYCDFLVAQMGTSKNLDCMQMTKEIR